MTRPVPPARVRAFIRTTCLGLGLAVVFAMPLAVLCSQLTFNMTPSLPRGLYTLTPGRIPERGDVVTFAIPSTLAPLVASRHYLPSSFWLLKRLVAVPGDHVCLDGERFVVNGQTLSLVAHADALARPLPAPYRFCGVVPVGLGFVATRPPTSLDSRFFGPIALNQLTPAEPTWTQSSP